MYLLLEVSGGLPTEVQPAVQWLTGQQPPWLQWRMMEGLLEMETEHV
jgi:hypothetical protein